MIFRPLPSITRAWILAGLLLCIPLSISAQKRAAGMEFLTIPPTAAMLGLGDAHGALLAGPGSLYSNPALMAFEPGSSVAATYTFWISNITNQFAGGVIRNRNRAFGLGIYYSGSNAFESRLYPGPPAGTFSVSMLALSGGYALSFKNLSAGASLHYLREEVFSYSADGISFSGGIAAQLAQERIRLSAAVQHLGEMSALFEQSTLLPSSVRLSSYLKVARITTVLPNDLVGVVELYGDLVQPLEYRLYEEQNESYSVVDKRLLPSLGMVLSLEDLLSLRFGVPFGETAKRVNLALEIEWTSFRFYYGVIPFETGYGIAHTTGLQYQF